MTPHDFTAKAGFILDVIDDYVNIDSVREELTQKISEYLAFSSADVISSEEANRQQKAVIDEKLLSVKQYIDSLLGIA
jgi:hypothetical protein